VALFEVEVRGDQAMSLAWARCLLDAGDLEGARTSKRTSKASTARVRHPNLAALDQVVQLADQSIMAANLGNTTWGRGELLAYIGSAGTVEIAVRDGRADERLALPRGTEVVPMFTDPAARRGP
jgi:hypothetical protein